MRSGDFYRLGRRVQLQRLSPKRDVLAVRSLAGELPSVPLATATEITVLLLEKEPESYGRQPGDCWPDSHRSERCH